jgi:hypothetical protein
MVDFASRVAKELEAIDGGHSSEKITNYSSKSSH